MPILNWANPRIAGSLLVLNGTPAGTGQRVVTTLLDDSCIARFGRCPIHTETSFCPLFMETFYFHDLLNGTAGAASRVEEPSKLIDVRSALCS